MYNFKDTSSVSQAKSLGDSGDIPQVEQIVGLVWCWLEWTSQYSIVYTKSHTDECWYAFFDILTECAIEGRDNGLEDTIYELNLQVSVSHHIEVSLKTRCDDSSSSSWWSHSRNEKHVFNPSERLFL
jgi:hypothetical protein